MSMPARRCRPPRSSPETRAHAVIVVPGAPRRPGDGHHHRDAFLPLNLVTYTWSVVPTTVQDVYDIQVTTTFVTNVPAPVVTVDPMYVDFSRLQL